MKKVSAVFQEIRLIQSSEADLEAQSRPRVREREVALLKDSPKSWCIVQLKRNVDVFSLLISNVANHFLFNSFMTFLKDPFLVLYISFFILLSAKSYLIHPQVINSMLMILTCILGC